MRPRTFDAASGDLADLLDSLELAETAVTIVDNGRPIGLLIKPDDFEGLLETLEVMSDPQLVADIHDARAEYREGRVIEGIKAARALRPGA